MNGADCESRADKAGPTPGSLAGRQEARDASSAPSLILGTSVREQISRLVRLTIDLPAVLREAVGITAAVVRVDACAIYLREGEDLVLRAARGLSRSLLGRLRMAPGEGLAGRVAETRSPLGIADVNRDERCDGPKQDWEKDFRSVLCLPLLGRGRLVGVIEVRRRAAGGFSNDETGTLSTLGDYIAAAVLNAQHHADAERSLREIRCLYELGETIASTLELPDLLLRLCRHSAETLRADGSFVRLWDGEQARLHIQSSFIRLRRHRLSDLYTIEGTVAEKAFQQQEVIQEVVGVVPAGGTRRQSLILLATPIASHGNRIGTMSSFRIRSRKAPFKDSQVELFRNMATPAGIAIQNAQLFLKARQAEQALRNAQDELLRKERLTTLGSVAAGVAHELRNPLVSIGGFARRIKREAGGKAKIARYSGVILREVDRLERLVRDVLVYASPQGVTPQPVDLHTLVSDMLPAMEGRAGRGAKKVRLQLNVPNGTHVQGDALLLGRAIRNLLDNAMEALPSGGAVRIEASHLDDGAWVELMVQDNGSGIDPQCVDHIFDPFFTTKGEGTGLGLAIVSNIVAAHGGETWAENASGGGACFHILIPAVPAGEKGQNRD